MKAYRQLFAVSLVLPMSFVVAACTGNDGTPSADVPEVGVAAVTQPEATGPAPNAATEAPTGFDNLNNGFILATAAFPDPQDAFNDDLGEFDQVQDIPSGLGPVYNAQACRECHQDPVSGAASQITEVRAGNFNGTNFVDPAGGSLINDRAIDAAIHERIPVGTNVRALRLSLNLLGDGFVESIDSNTLVAISLAQPLAFRGTVIQVPVSESNNNVRTGRFGWKNQ